MLSAAECVESVQCKILLGIFCELECADSRKFDLLKAQKMGNRTHLV